MPPPSMGALARAVARGIRTSSLVPLRGAERGGPSGRALAKTGWREVVDRSTGEWTWSGSALLSTEIYLPLHRLGCPSQERLPGSRALRQRALNFARPLRCPRTRRANLLVGPRDGADDAPRRRETGARGLLPSCRLRSGPSAARRPGPTAIVFRRDGGHGRGRRGHQLWYGHDRSAVREVKYICN